ncbi:class I tRNA ligase family protein [Algoriphagus sp. NG3]|uniref:class I tRNA ligase family protein n=1 Tax=Algoriphagus sp. NG3 TaxID=3097546 RepID=UPI002A820E34|nr:class I tRNA ligase family protein [Algoriphagus sp. NG3]WPR74860.1 class I tRNA ligase family protein [Algoriphagus sp. NG3]
MSQKKCPHCGKWSIWTNNYEDRCEHCGELLSPVELQREQKKVMDKDRNEKEWMFYINPDDSSIVKFFKKSGNLFYTVFMAIMTFIMWLIAALPG